MGITNKRPEERIKAARGSEFQYQLVFKKELQDGGIPPEIERSILGRFGKYYAIKEYGEDFSGVTETVSPELWPEIFKHIKRKGWVK